LQELRLNTLDGFLTVVGGISRVGWHWSLIFLDPLGDQFSFLLSDPLNVSTLVLVDWESQVEVVSSTLDHIEWKIEIFDVTRDATSHPWVPITIRENDVGILNKIFGIIVSSEVIQSPVIVWSQPVFSLAFLSVFGIVEWLSQEH